MLIWRMHLQNKKQSYKCSLQHAPSTNFNTPCTIYLLRIEWQASTNVMSETLGFVTAEDFVETPVQTTHLHKHIQH